MSETELNKTDVDGTLEKLREEFAGRAERAGTIEALAGGPVDRDLPQDYWSYSDAELENELWSRLPDLDRAMLDLGRDVDILPSCPLPAKPGLPGRIKGGLKNLLLRLALPLIRVSLEKQDRLNRKAMEQQDRLNRQLKHLQFIQFLAVKQLRGHLLLLESENRELSNRLIELETEHEGGGKVPDNE